MSKNNNRVAKRTALKGIGSALFGSFALSGTAASESNRIKRGSHGDLQYVKIRGSNYDPVATDTVEKVRKEFTKRKRSPHTHGLNENSEHPNPAVLNLEQTFSEDRIIGYNVLVDDEGKPREQYVTRGGRPSSSGKGQNIRAAKADTNRIDDRLHQKADDLLQVGAQQETAQVKTAGSSSWDIDWDEWYRLGSTDVYWEPDWYAGHDGKVGNVEFKHDIRHSAERDRAGARSKIRMEPGRQICNDGLDDYCTSPNIQDGYCNKAATVHHDWDQPINTADTEDLIVSTDPEGQISDIESSRGVSMDLEASRDPGLSIGYQSEVSFPAAQLIDSTTKATGRSKHKFRVNDASSTSAKHNAVFEVGSVAEYEGCQPSPPLYQRTVLEIDIDLEWGLDVPLTSWGHTESDERTFSYTTWC